MKESISDRLIVGNISSDELIEQWFNARISGDYKLGRIIKSYLSTFSPDISQGVALAGSEYCEYTRVAPAAGVSQYSELDSLFPRLGNTGCTFTGDITDIVSAHRHCDDEIEKRAKTGNITKVDYLSVSFTGLVLEEEQTGLINQIVDILGEGYVSVMHRSKGFHGYSNSAELVRLGDTGDNISVGYLAWSDKQGVFLELTGKGCEFIRAEFDDLYRLITVNAGRIGRMDIALDLISEYAVDRGFTIPKFYRDAKAGLYNSIYSQKGFTPNMNQAGDWSDIMVGALTIDTYNPLEHSPKGLTAYLGGNKSDNQICAYEKGKQLLGAADDGSNEYANPEYLGQKNWHRVERRVRRGGNKKWIDVAGMLSPDMAFIQHNKGLEDLLYDYADWAGGIIEGIELARKTEKVEKSIMLSRKLYWGKMQAGRLVRTLLDLGYSAVQAIESLVRKDGIKGLVNDCDDNLVCLPV